MELLGQMIRMRRLEAFVLELVNIHNEELEDKTLWEIWLHKVFDKSFNDFRDSLTASNQAAPTQEELQSIVERSYDALQSFVPDEGRVLEDGNIQAIGDDSG